jgi:chemotaxis protein MotA
MAVAPGKRRRRLRLDLASIALAPLGVAAILLAQAMDGVSLAALLQAQAALIVFGGTLGAVLVSYSPKAILQAVREALTTFTTVEDDSGTLSNQIVGLATRAHRRGLLTIDAEVDALTEPFLRDGLSLAIDGISGDALRDVIAVDAAERHARDEAPARIFDAAAGYAPTLGILGAVLGLIRVMEHLAAPGDLGSGIAVAFVSTVYGVGAANLLLLPIAGRLRERAALAARRREMMIQGICAIQQRLHPRAVSQKLAAFTPNAPKPQEVAARLARAGRGSRLA